MLRLGIANPFQGAEAYFEEETDSTMISARNLISEVPASGTLVCTSYQRQGRGRTEGRKWLGEKGQSLLFTILFRTEELPFQVQLFPLFAGWCLSLSVQEQFGIVSQVKWPNDVLADGAKLSGILCECSDGYVSCGIGLNLLQETFPDGLRRKSCSVRSLTGISPDRNKVLEDLLSVFRRELDSSVWSSDTWTEQFCTRLYRLGADVTVDEGLADAGTPLMGTICGVDCSGGLLIKDMTGQIVPVYAGEIKF